MRKSAIAIIFGLIIFYPSLVFAVFPDKVVENTKSAVVALYLDKDLNYLRASGFFIDSSGTIITAKHAVQNYSRLWAKLYDGRKLELILAGFQENDDLAILFPKISEKETAVFPYLKFGDVNKLAVGQPVMAVGNSLGGLWQVLFGNIKNLRKDITVNTSVNLDSTIEYNIFILKGFSGSPLVDENGSLLGINVASRKSNGDVSSYAISLKEIKSFLEEFYRNSPELIKRF